ncbi:hypothetical protein DAEQUDRAFT_289883 [Daedalea quercina L-15889]|uniref:Uncharacterized protein n=1 Tax=Daedalea quercina L-15889 TaxID=1314783 RepID=A0A165TXN5_9APHY|nr:hypothetical protein DAEQUDRAFT_289883 [Daedalea quercina L-15889]
MSCMTHSVTRAQGLASTASCRVEAQRQRSASWMRSPRDSPPQLDPQASISRYIAGVSLAVAPYVGLLRLTCA